MAAPMFGKSLSTAACKVARPNLNQTVYCSGRHSVLVTRSLHTRRNADIQKFPSFSVETRRDLVALNQVRRSVLAKSYSQFRLPHADSQPASLSRAAFLPNVTLSNILPTGSVSLSAGLTPTVRVSPAPPGVSVGRSGLGRRGYCSVSRACWSCHARSKPAADSNALFFCDVCNIIQPVDPDSNYFQVMQCDETFDLNTAQLTQTFRNLQRKLHPDKYSNLSEVEQDYSAMQSSEVNKAYSTLLKPLSRGLYLLELSGLTIEEGDAGIEVEFLAEVMETNEVLADSGDEVAIRRIGRENKVKLEAALKDLSQAFSKKDFPRAREILMRLKYFANIDDKVKGKLEEGFL